MLKLIVHNNPKSPVSEAYRTLRTNIQFSSFEKDVQVILLTSSTPSEGKTTTASNLALAVAQSGKKVILIDCDLRNPSVHKQFNISNQTGLSNLLAENLTLQDIGVNFLDNLCVVPSGTIPPNPAEMLGSKKMQSFLDGIKSSFDIIIIDSPPVLAVTDAQLLSTISDGVLLVVSSGEAEKEGALRAKNLLQNVNANILGVVLNKVELKSRRGYYYYYGDDKRSSNKK